MKDKAKSVSKFYSVFIRLNRYKHWSTLCTITKGSSREEYFSGEDNVSYFLLYLQRILHFVLSNSAELLITDLSDNWRRGEYGAGGQGPAGTPNETARLLTHSQLNTEPKFVEGQRCEAAALT